VIDVSVIIVSWNVKDALRANLARLFEVEDVKLEVIVVDNASSDGSGKMVRREFPEVKLIMNDWNSGFGYACNQGIDISSGKTIVLLNPDMLAGDGVFLHVHEVLHSDLRVGVVGVRLARLNGGVVASVRRDPGFLDQSLIVLKIPHLFRSRAVDRYLYRDFDYETSQRVEQIRGSFFAFRRELLDVVGTFDERFFIWFEEVDYCRRVREAGFIIRYLADVQCVDLVGQSFVQVSRFRTQGMFLKSMAQYFWKWESKVFAVFVYLMRPFFMLGGFLSDVKNRMI